MDMDSKTVILYHKYSRKRKSNLWLNKPKNRKGNFQEKSSESVDIVTTPPVSNEHTVLPSPSVLTAAPLKSNWKVTPQKSRKKLFKGGYLDKITEDMLQLIPLALLKFQTAGLLQDFVNFIKLITTGKFPMNNICLLLLFDVVRWYNTDTTSQMSYSEECMKFWKVLYRLFHGKVLRFMSGMRSGQLLEQSEQRGHINPQSTCINFAVPSMNTLNSFESCGIDIPKEIPPGIISQAIALKPTNRSYVLSVDGKKLAPGLSSSNGDQDLFGHEQSESLEALKHRLNEEVEYVNNIKDKWTTSNEHEKMGALQQVIRMVSYRLKDLRHLYLKQKLALNKFQKEAGADWRNSRFVYAISSVQSQIFQIKNVVQQLLTVNNSLMCIGSSVNGSATFVSDGQTDMYSQENWITLKEHSYLPEQFKSDSRFMKQRSVEWFDKRSKYVLTGSILFEALGLDSLKRQQKHFDKVIRKEAADEEISEEVRKRMDHGTQCEVHAIATLTTKVLPFFYPQLKFIEEGAHEVCSDKPFILISPDGSLGSAELHSIEPPLPVVGCEFKCPSPADYKTPVHYQIPKRYITQILAEMVSLRVEQLIYLCWTEESSTVFRATFDSELWVALRSEAESIYLAESPKRPTRLSKGSKDIAEKLQNYQDKFTEFLCEIPSVKCTSKNISQTHERTPYIFPITGGHETMSVPDIDVVLTNAVTILKEVYEICRKKATEVLVWLLSDTDRNWDPEIPHSLPVAYAMKGYSLPTKPMRDMHNHVLQACYDKDIDVSCSCFDGQWIKLATRDDNDNPLTMLQLQKDTYDIASKTNRRMIVADLSHEPILKDIKKDLILEKVPGRLNVSCLRLYRMIKSARFIKKNKPLPEVNTDSSSVSDSLSFLPDEALESLLEDDKPANDLIISLQTEDANDTVNTQQWSEDTNTTDDYEQTAGPIQNLEAEFNQPSKLLSDEKLSEIFDKLVKHSNQNVKKKWKGKSAITLKETVNNINKLQKCSHDELNVIITSTKSVQQKTGIIIRKSWKLTEKSNAISRVIGSGNQIHKERTVKRLTSLRDIAQKVVAANTKYVPKIKLNNVYAASLYDKMYEEWMSKSPFDKGTEIEGLGSTTWFSYPEYNDQRKKIEPKCLDAHHLLVNLRVKVCKDGVQGITKKAWQAVAERNNNIISKSLVFDLIDKQNNAFAKRTFSVLVEEEMRRLNFENEANFCHMIREWYEAEDIPGLSALERTRRKLVLKDFLLKDIDFGVYPMFGMFVKDFQK